MLCPSKFFSLSLFYVRSGDIDLNYAALSAGNMNCSWSKLTQTKTYAYLLEFNTLTVNHSELHSHYLAFPVLILCAERAYHSVLWCFRIRWY